MAGGSERRSRPGIESEYPSPISQHAGIALERARAAAKAADAATTRSDDAHAIARNALAIAQELKVTLGASPNPDLSTPGSGLCGGVANLRLVVETLVAEVKELRAEVKRHGQPPRRRALWGGVAAAITAIGVAISAVVSATRGVPSAASVPPAKPPELHP